MSTGARVTTGVAMGFAAVCFVLIGVFLGSALPAGPLPFYGLAAFCTVVTLACFVPRSRPLTLRLLGAAICVAFGVYAIESFNTDNFTRALLAFLILGLPGAYVAVVGTYPLWGRAAAAFHGSPSQEGNVDYR